MRVHQFVQTAAQLTLVNQGNAQLAHLTALNRQMAQQNAMVEAQASLSQVLFDTEQLVLRVHNTRPHDLFAAAVLAEQGLDATKSIQVTHFNTIDEKRSWSGAQAALTELSRSARMHPELAQKLNAYHSIRATFMRLQGAVGGDAAGHVARHEAAVLAASTQTHMAVSLGGLGVFVVLSLVGGPAPLPLIQVIAFVAAVVGGIKWRERAVLRAAARRALEIARRQAEECDAFMADVQGGRWLDGIWTQHALLNAEPPQHAMPASGAYATAHGYRQMSA